MNFRLLGFFAVLGAPFLFITYITFGAELAKQKTALDGLFSVLYMSGWMCSVIALWRAEATGTTRLGRSVLVVQLLFLLLANISNVMLLLQFHLDSKIYFILDLFWPVANLWMLATGITVVAAKRLASWMRYVPLAVGLWIPFTLLVMIIGGKSAAAMYSSGLYSTIAWLALGFMVLQLGKKQPTLQPALA